MFDIGSFELILILVLGLIILGPKQLKQLAKYVGGAISKIKKLSNEIQSDISDELKDNDLSKSYNAIKVDIENITDDVKVDIENITDDVKVDIENITDDVKVDIENITDDLKDIDVDDLKLKDNLKSNKK